MWKLALLLWLVLASPLPAQAVLEPPFGLKWGDSPERLIDWARRHTLDVRITIPGKQPDRRILAIRPESGTLPSSEAEALEARFQTGRLYEVTVRYGKTAGEADDVERRFNEMKRELSTEYGRLTANQQEKSVENDFATRTLSFHREPVKGLFLLLAFTEMNDLLRKNREATFSLVYRNDNLKQQLEAEAFDLNRPTDGR